MEKLDSNIGLSLNEKGNGHFYIQDDGELIAEMVISVSGNELTAIHTEVLPKGEGKGFGKKLVEAMAAYARKNNLKVIAFCPFVHKQFMRHPEEYRDIWKK